MLTKWVILFATSVFCSVTGFSQTTSRVWATIEDPAVLTSREMDAVRQQYTVVSIHKAFPNAHTPSLQNVYELACACENTELEKQLLTVDGVSRPVAVYDAVSLSVPDDYNLTFAPDYALDLIGAAGAWQYTHGNPDIILGITDDNYDLAHEELVGKIAAGGNTGAATFYHGTAVAITAAGNTGNGQGKSAIGYDCRLGLYLNTYNELLVARDNGARVVNASWHDGSCYFNEYCQNVINELYNDGVVVIAAAGNGAVTCGSANGVAYPAAYEHVISVSSVGPNDNHERYPGDPSSAHQHNAFVDLTAPGYDVPLSVSSGWYLTGNGSSFAAPFVTGTVGLMLSVNNDLTVDEVEEILKETAVNIDALNPSYSGLLGSGRLNAHAAVAMAATYGDLPTLDDVQSAFSTESETASQLTAGIGEAASVKPVVYPNPSAGELTIAYPFEKGQLLEIVDLTGKTEAQISVEAAVQSIRPEQLASGVHYIVLKEEGRIAFREKVVIL